MKVWQIITIDKLMELGGTAGITKLNSGWYDLVLWIKHYSEDIFLILIWRMHIYGKGRIVDKTYKNN